LARSLARDRPGQAKPILATLAEIDREREEIDRMTPRGPVTVEAPTSGPLVAQLEAKPARQTHALSNTAEIGR
jgi:hypothetical protein